MVRRTGSGGGSAGTEGLNIWTGSSAPSDEVGVWANSTLTDYAKYVIPYGDMYTDAEWVIDDVDFPGTISRLFAPFYSDGINYIPSVSGRSITIYCHNLETDVYTQPYSGTLSHSPLASGVCRLIDNTLYVFYSETGNSLYNGVVAYSFDISSGVMSYLTIQNDPSEFKYLYGGGTILYSGIIYFPITYSDSRTRYYSVFGYNIQSNSMRQYYLNRVVTSSTNSFGARCVHDTLMYFTGFTTASIDISVGAWTFVAVQTYPTNLYVENGYLKYISGTYVYGCDLSTPSASNPFTTMGSSPLANSGLTTCNIIDTGTEYVGYGFGPSSNNVLRYRYAPTDYKSPSIIVECGTEQNQADIITGEDGTATINVYRVYENQSGTPIQVTGQVRSGSGPWTDIQ